jgi:hypothetical protein
MTQVVRLRTARHRQSSDLGAVARGSRRGRFAQLSIRRFLGSVYRLVAPSPVLAAREGSAGPAGCGTSAEVRYPALISPIMEAKRLKNKGIPVSHIFGVIVLSLPALLDTLTCEILRYLDTRTKSET